MALITCPKCGHQVADTAASCPDCGFDITQVIIKHSVHKANIFVTVLVIFVVIGVNLVLIYSVPGYSRAMNMVAIRTEMSLVWIIDALKGLLGE
ncbi:MAG: zinc ribbon domain-containing protein [bacterium]|nr:zinc ribbon domain-containing protein [bacterium]